MEQENENGNGNKGWMVLYRTISVGLLGGLLFFAQQTYNEIKQQGVDIVTIKVDGAETKKAISTLEWRVGRLEDHQDNKQVKK